MGYIEGNGKSEAIFSIVLTGFLSFLILKIKGLIVLVISILFILLFMKNVKRKIGGVTGDAMGASTILVLLTGVIIR
ncbi:adenosylcobinamide-GDP ribazoletransferase [Leptotrichia sp. OH3620_COT-345]|uniref:adenosylcobinamide-GDP ribazoletransferase n=1 Tax=Leptotrichia sp. OH3620_COT-345 TaxID=2491048 RepID=UPI001F2AA706|nr:adenosylcobinamide-GDP ribazoletransferase [Leptotrichia sp. OH3620_COT-345]